MVTRGNVRKCRYGGHFSDLCDKSAILLRKLKLANFTFNQVVDGSIPSRLTIINQALTYI